MPSHFTDAPISWLTLPRLHLHLQRRRRRSSPWTRPGFRRRHVRNNTQRQARRSWLQATEARYRDRLDRWRYCRSCLDGQGVPRWWLRIQAVPSQQQARRRVLPEVSPVFSAAQLTSSTAQHLKNLIAPPSVRMRACVCIAGIISTLSAPACSAGEVLEARRSPTTTLVRGLVCCVFPRSVVSSSSRAPHSPRCTLADATVGTTPPGSMWAKVMVPGGPWGYSMHGASFKPLCECPKKFVESLTHSAGFMSCKCAGEGVGDIPTLEIVDHVRIPKDLPAGEWVLSW